MSAGPGHPTSATPSVEQGARREKARRGHEQQRHRLGILSDSEVGRAPDHVYSHGGEYDRDQGVRAGRSRPRAIQISVLEGLGRIAAADLLGALQVGDRASHLQDPVVGARGQTQAIDRALKEA